MRFYYKLALVLVFLFVLLPRISTAKIYLDIDQARALFPIAIPQFVGLDGNRISSPIANEMTSIIAQDLAFTGLFKILDPESFLEDSSSRTRDGSNLEKWSIIGAQGLLSGAFQKDRDRIVVEAAAPELENRPL